MPPIQGARGRRRTNKKEETMIRRLGAILVALALVLSMGLVPGVALADTEDECVRYGQGYWKQWLADPDSEWECAYGFEAEQLLEMLNTPARGDANVILSYQFIAAALNVGVNGCELPEGTSCDGNNVQAAFAAAAQHLIVAGGDSGATRSEILGWKDILEIWNKGYDPGVLSADNSHAEFTDNGDGTGTLTIVLRDAYGCPVYYGQRYFRAETLYTPSDRYYYIGGSILTYATKAHHEGDGIYTFVLTKPCGWDDIWNIAIAYGTATADRVVIHEGLGINIEFTPFMEGDWDVDFQLVGSTWEHVMSVDAHDADGSLTGSGGYPRNLEPHFTHEWDIVAGEVRCFTDKSTGTWIDVIEVDITIVYTTANPGYSLRFVGTMDFEAGTITGHVSGAHSGTFSATKR